MQTITDRLRDCLNAPQDPKGLDRSWSEVESELGIVLPDDYKEFINAYGSGQITSANGWLNIWNYRDRSLFRSLSDALCGDGSILDHYGALSKTDYPCPYPVYPADGGLLPFASEVDVQNLNWITKGPPDQWEVVYYFFDGAEFFRLEGDSFSKCILKMLANEYSGMSQPSSLAAPCRFTDFEMR